MTEIYFLGTGGWVASRDRDNTSLLIHQEKKLVLVDCPGSVIQKIKRAELDPAAIVSMDSQSEMVESYWISLGSPASKCEDPVGYR